MAVENHLSTFTRWVAACGACPSEPTLPFHLHKPGKLGEKPARTPKPEGTPRASASGRRALQTLHPWQRSGSAATKARTARGRRLSAFSRRMFYRFGAIDLSLRLGAATCSM